MRAAAGAHRDDPVQVEHPGPAQEVRVLGCVDVIGHDSEADVVAQRPAERGDQRSLARADGPADADPQRPPRARRCRVVIDAVVMRSVAVVVLSCVPWSGLKEPHLRSDMRFRQQVKGRRGRARQVAERPVRASGTLSGDLVDFSGEPGENPVARIGIKREQSHRRAERPGDRLVGRDPRGLARRAPGRRRGSSEHDRMMRPARYSAAHAPAVACRPRHLADGGKARQARCFRPDDPAPRAAARAPAAARPPAVRGPGSARRLRHQAQPRTRDPERQRPTLPAPRSSGLPRRRRPPGRPRPVPPSAAARAGTTRGSPGRSPCPPSRRAQRRPSARAPRRETASPRAAARPRSPSAPEGPLSPTPS